MSPTDREKRAERGWCTCFRPAYESSFTNCIRCGGRNPVQGEPPDNGAEQDSDESNAARETEA